MLSHFSRYTFRPRKIALIVSFVVLIVATASIGNHSIAAPAKDSQADPAMDLEIKFEEIASGLDTPVDIQHAGDARLFVIEKPGRIRIIDASENLLSTPFLDIENRVDDSSNEEGLLGLAFHPNYATNGYFYLNYTVGGPARTRISRFSASAADPNVADPASEFVMMEFGQPFGNHNGGQLQFGPDGYLYIAVGDGGSGGDPNDAGQTNSQLLGKILRIDVDGTNGSGAPECDANGTYTIPADNPFVGSTGGSSSNCDEIWATGLRNPWRFSFDAATGDMWIGDVGQNKLEEINFQPANSSGGENYGWRCYEGNDSFDTSGCQPASAYIAPVHEYGRSDGCSVTGGLVYRGTSHPALVGHYIFTDYCTAIYWTLSGDPTAPTLTTLDITDGSGGSPAAFGVDLQGEIYVASRGNILRIENPNPGTTPVPSRNMLSYLPLMIQE